MSLLEILKKYVIPTGVTAMAIDSWVHTRFGPNNPSVLKSNLLKSVSEYKANQAKLQAAMEKVNEYQNQNVVLKGQALSISENINELQEKLDEVKKVKQELLNRGLNDIEQKDLTNKYNFLCDEFHRLTEKNTNLTNNLVDKIVKTDSSSQSDSSSNIVPGGSDITPSIVTDSTVVESSSSILDSTNVKESSILEYFSEMRGVINEELASLSSEQLCCLSNALGFIMVLGGLVTITTILIGQYFIDYFKLEQRFPKLAKYIKLRQTFKKYYLIVNLIIMFLISIFFVALNIFMFIM